MLKFPTFFLILMVLSLRVGAAPAAPVQIQSYLKDLPEQKLTLDYILKQALAQADIFKAHQSEAMRAESVEMQTLAAEDLTLSTGYEFFDLRTDPLNPLFQTIRTSGWEAKVGAEQFFSSGTQLSVLGLHGPQRLDYRTNPTIDVQQTSLSIGLRQSLWNDFFGRAYRRLRRSAQSSKQAILDGMWSQMELSSMDVITLYYQTWLKQQIAKNLLEGVERKDRLARILKDQARRRVLETADLLQVESLTLSAEADYLNTKQELQGAWEQLVISLKLPADLIQVDASQIPMSLDTPEPKATGLCQQLNFEDLQNNSATLKQAAASVDAASDQVKALEAQLQPNLDFIANYTVNGVDRSGRETFRNIERRDYPAVTAGVNLSFPLQNRAQKSRYLAAKAQYEQLMYRQQILRNDLQTSWSVVCKTLKQKQITRDKFKQVNEKNKRRVALENRRYQMGRLRPMEWTQAEETEAADYLKYQTAEVEVRQVSWEIQRQAGALGDYLRSSL